MANTQAAQQDLEEDERLAAHQEEQSRMAMTGCAHTCMQSLKDERSCVGQMTTAGHLACSPAWHAHASNHWAPASASQPEWWKLEPQTRVLVIQPGMITCNAVFGRCGSVFTVTSGAARFTSHGPPAVQTRHKHVQHCSQPVWGLRPLGIITGSPCGL